MPNFNTRPNPTKDRTPRPNHKKFSNNIAMFVAIAIRILLLVQAQAAASSSYQFNHNAHHGGGGKVQIHLQPASSWIRWLERQMELIDSELEFENASSPVGESMGGDTTIVNEREDGHHSLVLRHLEQREQQTSAKTTTATTTTHSRQRQHIIDELQYKRQLLQIHFDHAMDTLKETPAAYASVMEFPSTISILEHWDTTDPITTNDSNTNDEERVGNHHHHHHRHLKESLVRHNEAIQEYNEYHRQYSKYEWSFKEGRGKDLDGDRYNRYLRHKTTQFETKKATLDEHNIDENNFGLEPRHVMENESSSTASTAAINRGSTTSTSTTSNKDATLLLIGSNWKAIEIAYLPRSTPPMNPNSTSTPTTTAQTPNTPQLHPILTDYPITISFDEKHKIGGNAGCNSYHSSLTLFTTTLFNVSFVATTRMLCRAEGVMEQEKEYVRLLTNRRFSYEIVKNATVNGTSGDEENGIVEEELRLYESHVGDEGEETEGFVLARFARLPNKIEKVSTIESTITTVAAESSVDDVNNPNQQRDADALFPLVGSSWKATEIAHPTSAAESSSSTDATSSSNNVTLQLQPTLDDFPITLSFPSANSMSGHAGCNSYNGELTPIETSKFHVGVLLMTMMYCVEDGVMVQEGDFTNLLSEKTFSYDIVQTVGKEGEELELRQFLTNDIEKGAESEVLARFVRLPDNLSERAADSTTHHAVTKVKYTTQNVSNSTTSRDDEEYHGESFEDTHRSLYERRMFGTTKKNGGMFNSYQTSPVFQGYGTHYATIWVGTPSQRKTVIVDTGSHFTAFPCIGCVDCGEEHHTDKYFDPAASSTFRALKCGECHDAKCVGKRCIFSQVYTEGSSWHAYESVDRVFIGGRELSSVLSPINAAFTSDFLFGCQTKETGLFVTQLADGIMGMSAHPSTLPRNMYENGKLEHNMFSMCFKREVHVSKQGVVAGFITLGGIDSRVDLTPMVYARNVATSGWFTVFVKSVYVRANGGQSVRPDHRNQKLQRVEVDLYEFNSGKGVIVDSGTTDTYLHKSVAEPFDEVWQQVTGRSYSHNPVKISKKDLLLLPTVLIQLAAYDSTPDPMTHKLEITPGLVGEHDPSSPQDILLAIPATHYMEYSPSRGTYTPRIYFTESQGGVIGSNAMQGHNVLFDWENKRVGFAESTCEYEENNPQTEEEVSMLVDCKLGAPSLSTQCSDSVDLSKCDDESNADLTLAGTEVWTRIVQAPGTTHGMTCEEVSISQNESNGGEKMEVLCDGKGICREYRHCDITCANAIALGSAGGGLSRIPETPAVSCGGGTWSACDYTCSQTRINVIYMSDGKCHEEKGLQFTRPCHVHACGREDPCRVPFVIHAIIKIRGGVASLWNKKSEELTAEAFAAVVNNKKGPDDALFGPGDVIVARVSPWKASDDNIFGDTLPDGQFQDEEIGMQLVVETSIANYNAILASNNVADDNIKASMGRKHVPRYICDESDLQPLAGMALDIHRQLAQSNFVALMLHKIKTDETDGQIGRMQTSPFYNTFEDAKLAGMSRVVTSWTIKTDIGGAGASLELDIDSYTSGTSPMLLLALTTSVILGYWSWTRGFWTSKKKDQQLSPRRRWESRNRGKYSRIESARDDSIHDEDDSSTAALGDGNTQFKIGSSRGELELPPAPKNYDYSIGSIGSLSAFLARAHG